MFSEFLDGINSENGTDPDERDDDSGSAAPRSPSVAANALAFDSDGENLLDYAAEMVDVADAGSLGALEPSREYLILAGRKASRQDLAALAPPVIEFDVPTSTYQRLGPEWLEEPDAGSGDAVYVVVDKRSSSFRRLARRLRGS